MTGVHTHISVKHTVYAAFVRGYNVAEDGVEAFTGDDHVAGLKCMKQNHGARISPLKSFVDSEFMRPSVIYIGEKL
jgi:nicotinamidase-related amidase